MVDANDAAGAPEGAASHARPGGTPPADMDRMPSAYDPHSVEERVFGLWAEGGHFAPTVRAGERPFTIVIPPPNVTGSLHMGHALNNTIQDVVVRRHRMMGEPTLWLPGTDHAGIATQNKVEQQIAEEGLSRHDVGREAFVERVWAWKEKYGSTIIRQLKKMGCSCDYSRERFTMDESYSWAVRKVFVELYHEGLVYRGLRLINWCPRCHTALSDIEVEHEGRHSTLYYVRYPIKGEPGHFIQVATVRPESMLGDTAVAVNPDDERYAELVGRTAVLPLVGRELPIIADGHVDPGFGTGAVKITPAHDPNDYDMAERHGLDKINILTDDAHVNEEGGRFAGMERFEAREAVVAALDDEGYLVRTEDYEHSVGTCYRCHTIIEPFLSEQWFVDMKPLAAPAIEAVKEGADGEPARVRFVPERWKRLYLEWMENIRDWCVSRQIWWGHQIPAWYCECGETIVAEEAPWSCPACGSQSLRQDEDVLDTWFSSALWPFATLGWPDDTADLAYFYPTSVLSTARDILYLWVARMIMMGLRFKEDVPFDTVIIHQTVLNFEGRRMSKSLGTGVDPLDLMEKYGADGMRFGLMLQATQAQDMRFTEDKLQASRNFANKIFNAARFVLSGADGEGAQEEPSSGAPGPPTSPGDRTLQVVRPEPCSVGLPGYAGAASCETLADRWILSRLARTVTDVDRALTEYEFGEATRRLYEFFWGEYCDWYVEWAKPALKGERGATEAEREQARRATRRNLIFVLDVALRLLHPFMPFITEELWRRLPRKSGPVSLMVAAWPRRAEFAALIDVGCERGFGVIQEVISHGREVRAQTSAIKASDRFPGVRIEGPRELVDLVMRHETDILGLVRADRLEVGAPDAAAVITYVPRTVGELKLWFETPHADAHGVDEQLAVLEKKLAKLGEAKAADEAKLANPGFAKAPEAVREKVAKRLAATDAEIAKVGEQLDALRSS